MSTTNVGGYASATWGDAGLSGRSLAKIETVEETMATSDQTAGLNSVDARGNGLRVEFFLEGDRYAHRVLAVSAGSPSIELLRSIEGTPEQDWPDSPALQALNVDQLRQEGGPAALIGMSGRTHWSLSVERRLEPGSAALLFDAACRVRLPSLQISTNYRVGPSVKNVQWESGALRLASGRGDCRIMAHSVDSAENAIAEIVSVGDRCTVVCKPEDSQHPSRTVRWQYGMVMIASG